MKKIIFHNLITLARQETVPVVNVADSVIATLSGITRKEITDPWRPYLWMMVGSASAAACILIAATLVLQAGNDSVSDMMNYVAWVTQ